MENTLKIQTGNVRLINFVVTGSSILPHKHIHKQPEWPKGDNQIDYVCMCEITTFLWLRWSRNSGIHHEQLHSDTKTT